MASGAPNGLAVDTIRSKADHASGWGFPSWADEAVSVNSIPRLGAVAVALSVCACGAGSSPITAPVCDVPTGCVRSGLVSGTCQCLEWQLVSIEVAPVKFMVVGVVYMPVGNQSYVAYGHSPGSLSFPATSSDLGIRWRSVVSAEDATESVAAAGPTGGVGYYLTFGSLAPVTPSTVAMAMAPNEATLFPAQSDVPSHEDDQIYIWINPAAAVTTDYAGNKAVSWSFTSDCQYFAACNGAQTWPFTAGMLDGTYPPPTNLEYLEIFNYFTPEDRASILKYDAFFDPPGRDPSTIATDARFDHVTTTKIDFSSSPASSVDVSWRPCTAPLTDNAFQVLAQSSQNPFGMNESLMTQNTVVSLSSSCPVQMPAVQIGTSTPGCSIGSEVYVDKMFGSLVMIPSGVTAPCTTTP